MRRFSAILVTGIACLAPAPTASAAEEGGAKNVVVVSTTADGTKQARAGLQVSPLAGPTVGNENLALARATNCTGCRSAAVAIQAVFVTGNPNTVVPKNAAVAANGGCNDCGSYAYAYQDVFSTPGPVHLSTEGRQNLNRLRQQFEEVADDNVSSITGSTSEPALCQGCAELTAKLDDLKNQFKDIVEKELVAAGYHVTGVENRQVRMSFGGRSADAAPRQPTNTTTSDQGSTPTGDQTSGTSGSDTSSGDTSGTDSSGTSGTDSSGTSGTDQTSGSDSGTSTSGP